MNFTNVNETGYDATKTSVSESYSFWVNNLFERCARLAVWNGTGDDLDGGIDPIHIEKPLLLDGHAGICPYNGVLTSFRGTYSGVTVYTDRFPVFMVQSPVYAAAKTIGKDIAIIRNNSTETNLRHLVHRYAVLLSHVEITLVNVLVNVRANSVPCVLTNKQLELVKQWRSGLYNGQVAPILDSGFKSLQWADVSYKSNVSIQELLEARENLLNSFYNSIGVRTTWNKKGNMIADEVGGNDSMLLLNINDMIEARKRGCERVNKMFGTNWSVDKCEELKYNEAISVDNTENGKIQN